VRRARDRSSVFPKIVVEEMMSIKSDNWIVVWRVSTR